MAFISLFEVGKTYGTASSPTMAVTRVDLDIEDGEVVALTGPSGSGKSTLLNIVGLITSPTTGSVIVDGVDRTHADREQLRILRSQFIGFVHQRFHLVGHLTAAQNVMMALRFRSMPRAHRDEAVHMALDEVGLTRRRSHRPGELSGGEQQRVAIARALVTNPRLVIADEPTGNLDSVSGAMVLDLLTNVSRRSAVVIATHDPEVTKIADRTLRMVDGVLDMQRA